MAGECELEQTFSCAWRAAGPGRPQRGRPTAVRRGPATAVLAGVYVLAFFVMASDLKAGVGLLFSANVMLALIDWNAFVSLGGLAPWLRIGVAARAAVVVLLLTGCVAPPIVLWRTVQSAWQARHRSATVQ